MVLESIEQANQLAVTRIQQGEPILVDIVPAQEAMPDLTEGVLLHAGPPLQWPDMCAPMKGSIIGALRYEGWAKTEAESEAMASGAGIAFHPAHHFGAVGPMTGIITSSMPVFVVENRAFGNRSYCTINEGLGKVLRYGANDDGVLDRLRWIQHTLGPALGEALRRSGGVELRPMMAQALQMGDEMHQRNIAATSLFLRRIAPHLTRNSSDRETIGQVTEFLGGNDQFFLNLGMAAAKATMDPAGGVENSTVVHTMSRNGTEFGIRVSCLGERWFTAPVNMPQGLYFPGFSAADANPDIGDSAIMETLGLGAFAMAASPAVVGFVGAGTLRDAMNYSHEMGELTLSRNPNLTIPGLDFQGTPCGIDLRKVVETGIAPAINTGIAHREAGIGQVGAGIVRAPLECFHQALEAVVAHLQG